ncbi:hypothetical protein [Thiomicrorhabdus sediminis]|uniref:hypothetical protein n=1 Tax=Thiomicrorhabdus sediminis TaxID=2580412 RepID=UPI00143CF230|nr:hypothetical protein [Thiomicrorhabdus sediminis]
MNSRDIALHMALHVPLKQLFEFKYRQQDNFNDEDFSALKPIEKALIVNALISYRLSCIDHLHFFDDHKIDFMLNEFIRAYEDFLKLKHLAVVNYVEEIKSHFPKAVEWIQFIEQQARVNKHLYTTHSGLFG